MVIIFAALLAFGIFVLQRNIDSRTVLERTKIQGNIPVGEIEKMQSGSRVGPDTWNPV